MEVGAVKQAFNNEVILMKKSLNQAKIQVIHKLTRKAKTLTEKKLPEKLQQKLKKKAESAVKEVLIIKKIKAKDLAKFIVTHKGELNTYLNKPVVDQDKACARLLLHKSLQAKYKTIRSTFGNTSINDLLMSRLERRKLKKEEREKQKNKKKAKEDKNKVVNGDSVWDVEEIGNTKPVNDKVNDNEEMDIESEGDDNQSVSSKASQSDEEIGASSIGRKSDNSSESEQEEISEDVTEDINSDIEVDKAPKGINNKSSPNENSVDTLILKLGKEKNTTDINNRNSKDKKKKDLNKNKNFNEKILKRKFNKDLEEKPVQEVKVVDPFFITSTGENYISVVEPRQPDEVKEIHKQGNRKYRRAVMFGHVPPKPRRDTNNKTNNNRKFGGYSDNKRGFNSDNDHSTDNKFSRNNTGKEVESEEKLHPSWAAKKKVSSLLPFAGRKTVFNDDD